MNVVANQRGWVTSPLIDVATLKRGYDLPVQDRSDGPHPIFAANGTVGFHVSAKCKGPGVVTGRSGTIGKVHFIERDFWPLNTSLYVTNFHGNDPKWVYYMLQSFGLERFAQGAGVPTLNRNLIHGEPILVPSLSEQRRIAAILDQTDALRVKRRDALAQLDSLSQSIFIEMFGDPTANPLGWQKFAFGELGENQDSQRVPVKSSDREGRQGKFPYYGASGIIDWVDDYIYDGERLLIGEDGANLLARATPIAYIANGQYWVNNHAHVIAFNGRANLRFLEYCIEQMDLGPYISGSAQPKLNRGNLDRIPVPSPPLALQKTFANRIQSVESLKATQHAALQKLDGLFASLQHCAFRGKL